MMTTLQGALATYGHRTWGMGHASLTLTDDAMWTEESEHYRYELSMESEDGELNTSEGTDDYDEARQIAATMLRTAREHHRELRAEMAREAAEIAVERLLDGGKAQDVLNALKAAGLL